MSRRARRNSFRRRRANRGSRRSRGSRGGRLPLYSHQMKESRLAPRSRKSKRSKRSRRNRSRSRRSRGGVWNPLKNVSRPPRGFRRKDSRPQYVQSEMGYDYSLKSNDLEDKRRAKRRAMHGMGTKSGSCLIM
jgi:hypothetical protein